MSIYYFDWYDLKLKARNNFEGILILTYATTIGYNNCIADGSNYLMAKLFINKIPRILISDELIVLRGGKLYNNYKCNIPTAYFKYTGFLNARQHLNYKIYYLYLLSHRPITNNNNFIPKKYVEQKYWNNPFTQTTNDKIKFIFEK